MFTSCQSEETWPGPLGAGDLCRNPGQVGIGAPLPGISLVQDGDFIDSALKFANQPRARPIGERVAWGFTMHTPFQCLDQPPALLLWMIACRPRLSCPGEVLAHQNQAGPWPRLAPEFCLEAAIQFGPRGRINGLQTVIGVVVFSLCHTPMDPWCGAEDKSLVDYCADFPGTNSPHIYQLVSRAH